VYGLGFARANAVAFRLEAGMPSQPDLIHAERLGFLSATPGVECLHDFRHLHLVFPAHPVCEQPKGFRLHLAELDSHLAGVLVSSGTTRRMILLTARSLLLIESFVAVWR